MKKIRIGTVFSGIGSVEFALRRMNIKHEIAFACDNGEREIDIDYEKELRIIRNLKSIRKKQEYSDNLYLENTRKANFVEKSYIHNYDLSKGYFFQDIKLLDGYDFKDKIDLFVGGSPCQSFSIIGSEKGLADSRGTLFYEFARLVKEIRPKVFIYENVRAILNNNKKQTWKAIESTFKSIGYKFTYKVLNSKDFGIPQNRRRVFIIGFLDQKIEFNFPKEKELKYTMQDFLVDDCCEGSFSYDNNGMLVIKKVKGKAEPRCTLSDKVQEYVLKGGTKDWYQKPELDLKVARTLLKTMGNKHRAGVDNYISLKNNKIRMLSVREAHRLMGFTDDYELIVSTAQGYKQAGNSIVVDVLMELINEIIKTGVFK